MAGRKLKDRISSMVSNTEPSINIPTADVATSLAEAAKNGFTAIEELHADRNRAVELAQLMHQETVYLRNINNSLREDIQRLRFERDRCMKLVAHVSALFGNTRDLTVRIDAIIRQEVTTIESIEPLKGPTNNPDLPALDTTGLPQFNSDGIPEPGDEWKPLKDEHELKRLAERLNGSSAGSSPALQQQQS